MTLKAPCPEHNVVGKRGGTHSGAPVLCKANAAVVSPRSRTARHQLVRQASACSRNTLSTCGHRSSVAGIQGHHLTGHQAQPLCVRLTNSHLDVLQAKIAMCAVQRLLKAGADHRSGLDLQEMQCACSLALVAPCSSLSSSGRSVLVERGACFAVMKL